jgi:hypothetical protein
VSGAPPSDDILGDVFGGSDVRLSSVGSVVDLSEPLQNPARLVQLVFALVQGGNSDAWLELATHAGVTLDAACDSAVAFLDKFMAKAGYHGPSKPPPPQESGAGDESKEGAPAEEWDPVKAAEKDFKVRNKAVSQLLESGTGRILCDLLVEGALIVPHTKVTLRSPSLWAFLEKAAVPTLHHFLSKEHPTTLEVSLITVIIELLQHILSELVSTGLLEDAFVDHNETLTSLGVACDGIMEGRASFFREIGAVFRDTLRKRNESVTLAESTSMRPGISKQGTGLELPPRAMRRPSSFSAAASKMSMSGEDTDEFANQDLNREEFFALMKYLSKGGPESNASGGVCRRGALPGINFFDDAKLQEAFDVADQVISLVISAHPYVSHVSFLTAKYTLVLSARSKDGDGGVNLQEFIGLFELVIEGALTLGGARVHIYHRISKRSVECIERISIICAKVCTTKQPFSFIMSVRPR